jgi:hypothetical protein
MKRLILPLLILSLTLTACSAAQNTGTAQTAGNDPATRTLPPTTQFVLGIFKLEGTDQAVTAEQAKDLLPLWQVYSSLSQATLRPRLTPVGRSRDLAEDQMQAIQIQPHPEDFFTLMQEQGSPLKQGREPAGPRPAAVPSSSGRRPALGGGRPRRLQGGDRWGNRYRPVNGTPRRRMDRIPPSGSLLIF